MRRGPPSTARRGFTLIEMVMVLALIGVIAVLAGPSLVGMTRRWNLSTTMRTLYGAILETQSRARASGLNHRLVLDSKAMTATILKMDIGSSVGSIATTIYLDPSHVFGFRPQGYPQPVPKPYDSIPRNLWCTFCGGTSGYIEIDSQGLIVGSTSGDNRGSIALYDPTGKTQMVEGILYVGRTGDIRLYRANW